MSSVYAGVHPVQLENGTDSAKCVECHDDKAKGKNVHPAVSTGCLTCHLIRNAGNTTRVNLKTAKVTTLCFECHADKEPTGHIHQVHAPVVQNCVRCHNPHTSDNEHLLLKRTSGGKVENLCLGCHQQGLDVPDKGSRHAALDMGCDTCHVTHKLGNLGLQEFDFHLTKAVPELCLGCHDAKDAKLVQAHHGQPIAGAVCTNCHDPHASQSPKLMQKYIHPPFADKSCDTCHQPAENGKVVLTQTDSRALCVMCHDKQAKSIESARVPHPGAQGDCVACHNPHAGRYPKFIQPTPVIACEGCHPDIADIHNTSKVLHPPAFQQGCSTCHTPHGGEREYLLRADINDLCLACHGPNAKGQKVEGSNEVTILDGVVSLPDTYLSQVYLLRLDAKGLGHPQDRHPVGGVPDPNAPGKMMSCVSCHTPHGGGRSLLSTGLDTSGTLCAQCHPDVRSTVALKQQNPASNRDKKRKKQE